MQKKSLLEEFIHFVRVGLLTTYIIIGLCQQAASVTTCLILIIIIILLLELKNIKLINEYQLLKKTDKISMIKCRDASDVHALITRT